MKKIIKTEYHGRYGTGDKLDNPSSIIKLTTHATIASNIATEHGLTIEICNPSTPWWEDNEQMRYVWGLSDGSYPLDGKIATKIIKAWEKNW